MYWFCVFLKGGDLVISYFVVGGCFYDWDTYGCVVMYVLMSRIIVFRPDADGGIGMYVCDDAVGLVKCLISASVYI